jgi:hypothetical protein
MPQDFKSLLSSYLFLKKAFGLPSPILGLKVAFKRPAESARRKGSREAEASTQAFEQTD